MSRHSNGPKIYLRGNWWWVRWSAGRDGEVRTAVLDSTGKSMHKSTERKEILAAAARMYDQWFRTTSARPEAKTRGVTVGELTGRCTVVKGEAWSRKTKLAYCRYMGLLEKFFGPDSAISELTLERAEDFKLWAKAHGGKKGGQL